jgi:hypothetical protein
MRLTSFNYIYLKHLYIYCERGNEDGGPCLNAFLIWRMVIFEHKWNEIGSLPAMFDGDN